MNIFKFMSGFIIGTTGLTWTINVIIRYPLAFNDLPDTTLILIILSIFALGFGLWAIGDSLEK